MADMESSQVRTLRPRKSFLARNKNLLEPDKLRSPLKLADGRGNVLPITKDTRNKGGRDLFPVSPVEVAGLKKFATSLTGAFTGSKGRTSGKKLKAGFDLSDWNEDLAAIASNPPSRTSSPNKSVPGNSTLPRLSLSEFGESNYDQDDLVTPTATSFPLDKSIPSGSVYAAALELPVSVETRRRKSDEMEEGDRVDFQSNAPPVRRDLSKLSHNRSHSLAHAHTLRSSRSLSHHASLTFDSPRNPIASTSTFPSSTTKYTQPLTFSNPFVSPFTESDHSIFPPPAKKISLLSPQQRREDRGTDENVFGGSLLNISVGPGKKPNRTKSLTRVQSNFETLPIPSSNSHPGWIGDGFNSAKRTGPASNSITALTGELIRGRSKTSSSATLDTLNEEGTAIDHFSPPNRPSERNGTEEIMSTPRRRRSDGAFNLLGGKVMAVGPRRGSLGVEWAGMGNRRSQSDLDTSMEEDEEASSEGDNSPQKQSTPIGGRSRKLSNLQFNEMPSPIYPITEFSLPSRRATSLDSLYLSSIRQGAQPSPFKQTGNQSLLPNLRESRDPAGITGRKRNSNGTLLAGPATSNLAATPLVAGGSSPEPWNVRETQIGMDEEDEEEDVDRDSRDMDWGGSISPPPPSLTDGATTSTSSSLSTSLSSHAERDHVRIATGLSPSQSQLSLSNSGSHLRLSSSTFFTPQSYQHVRPLQAAFMSTGLVSKRSRARNDSGIGLGLASSYRSNYGPPNDSFDTSIPLDTPMMEESVSTLPILAPSHNVSNPIMPDTPIKKNGSFSHSSNPELSSILLESKKMDETNGFNKFTVPDTLRNSGSPSAHSSGETSRESTEMIGESPSNNVSPTIHAARTDIRMASAIGQKGTSLYRRRSSGHLGGDSIGKERSGGSTISSGSTIEMEPMTPTKSVGMKWSEGKTYSFLFLFFEILICFE